MKRIDGHVGTFGPGRCLQIGEMGADGSTATQVKRVNVVSAPFRELLRCRSHCQRGLASFGSEMDVVVRSLNVIDGQRAIVEQMGDIFAARGCPQIYAAAQEQQAIRGCGGVSERGPLPALEERERSCCSSGSRSADGGILSHRRAARSIREIAAIYKQRRFEQRGK